MSDNNNKSKETKNEIGKHNILIYLSTISLFENI